MANTQIAISQNGKTTLATAGKYCERNIDINVAVASAGDDIPAYVKAEADSLASKVVSAQGNSVFTLAAITDLHYGNGSYTDGILHASQALAYINKQITLDAFAVLGDYTDGYPVDNIDNAFGDCRKVNSLLSPMESVPNLRIQGNHDFYNGYAQFVHYHIQAYSEGVTWGDKVGGYFYRDFADKKLRIICVNTTETDNANIGVSTTQYTWFANALDLSAKSDAKDWQILVLSHHPLDWYVTDSTYRFAYIVEAYKNGASGTVGGVSYDFTGKNSATLIGNIHGHIHNLLTGYINKGNVNTSNPTKVLRICTPESCINRANQYDGAWKEATSYNKTINSAKDTSFVIYCIDLNTQSIKAFCYGAGYDREISYAPIAPAVYNIANSLTNCTASGVSTIVKDGTASIIISANSGYELPDAITVSGANYTWDKTTGTVVLSNPISDVIITVVAVEANLPNTNQSPLSINADGSQYVGDNGEDGYRANYRLNSSGAETAAANSGVNLTGFIPVKAGDTVYLSGVQLSLTATGGKNEYTYIALYNSSFTMKSSQKANTLDSSSYSYLFGDLTTGNDGFLKSFRIVDSYNNVVGTGGYMRISAVGIDENAVITINEPISDTPDAPVAPTVYNITKNVTNCTASGASTIAENGTATITISANNEYELPDTITVSGASYTWDKSTGTVVLSNPTGNVTVTVVAVEIKPKYTNQIPLSINADGTQFVGTNGEDGYKTGYRLNSSGTETAQSAIEVTGFMPCTKTDVLRFANMTFAKSGTGLDATYISVYDSNKSKLISVKLSNIPSSVTKEWDSNDNLTMLDMTSLVNAYSSTYVPAYFRISGYHIDANSIITINEPIE